MAFYHNNHGFHLNLLFFLKLSLTPVRFYILSRISFLELRRLSSISRCFLGEKLKISLQLVAVERVKKLPRCELNFKLPPPALRIGIQPSNQEVINSSSGTNFASQHFPFQESEVGWVKHFRSLLPVLTGLKLDILKCIYNIFSVKSRPR